MLEYTHIVNPSEIASLYDKFKDALSSGDYKEASYLGNEIINFMPFLRFEEQNELEAKTGYAPHMLVKIINDALIEAQFDIPVKVEPVTSLASLGTSLGTSLTPLDTSLSQVSEEPAWKKYVKWGGIGLGGLAFLVLVYKLLKR